MSRKDGARRLAIVVQRYGDEVNGGAEHLARTNAEHLARDPRVASVNVLTTCARDHSTWAPHYAPGTTVSRGVTVERFANARRLPMLGLSGAVKSGFLPLAEPAWFIAQGPFSPGLLRRLYAAGRRDEFDAYVFYTYLYATTVFGLPLVAKRSVLIPTAHDEPAIHMQTFRALFRLPRAYGYLTTEEERFLAERFSTDRRPGKVIGTGIDIQDLVPDVPQGLPTGPYVTYLGRVESGKGCARLFAYFDAFRRAHADATFTSRHGPVYRGRDLKLAIVGRVSDVPIPNDPAYVHLGFLSETEKAHVLAGAEALFMPSFFESLSLVLLEAWALGCPALVDSRCEVTRGQTLRSGAGRLYQDERSFGVALSELLASPDEARQRADAGRAFIADGYTWDRWTDAMLSLIDAVDEHGDAGGRAAPKP